MEGTSKHKIESDSWQQTHEEETIRTQIKSSECIPVWVEDIMLNHLLLGRLVMQQPTDKIIKWTAEWNYNNVWLLILDICSDIWIAFIITQLFKSISYNCIKKWFIEGFHVGNHPS